MNVASSGTSDSTSSSLLSRVRRRDQQAWRRFADLYTPLIYAWARRRGLRGNDAVDIVQEVFRTVADKIDDFGQGHDITAGSVYSQNATDGTDAAVRWENVAAEDEADVGYSMSRILPRDLLSGFPTTELLVTIRQLTSTSFVPDDIETLMHQPWRILLLSFAMVLTLLPAPTVVGQDDELPAVFQDLPADWVVQKLNIVPAAQRDVIGQRLGGKLDKLTNAVLAKRGRSIQINVVECANDESAGRVQTALQKGKLNKRQVHRNGTTVFELVARNQDELRLALAARYELNVQPRRVSYRVGFDAAPVKAGDWMKWNSVFNLFLQLDRGGSESKLRAQIDELAKHFDFDRQLTLRQYGQGTNETKWSFVPHPVESLGADDELRVYRFGDLPRKAGVPFVSVTGDVSSATYGLTPTSGNESDRLTVATPHWPVDDPEIRRLATEITQGKQSPRDKVTALLLWLLPGQNIRFEGPIVGSRYGVKKVVDQRFGHCWDFSDLFVTLCRASGVPCRQVFGWIHEGEGHVWAEVLIDDKSWWPVDPTAASACGSDYIPLVSSNGGEMPLLYISEVRVEVIADE